ncbi:MAG TPA: prepilin-type N-terminal cleavage/methylation domain-containing protein [Syntrophorhabdaceae bacterium]|nr:prepilin-type N-terminal cleavage/methylation domain-containing protein [Syntrophorhabdaceae bacterium]
MMIRSENKGFTLIELITVIAVLSILSIFTFSFIDNAVKTYRLIKEQSPLYADGTYIMERITRELRDAGSVTDPVAGSSSTLTFKTAHIPPSLIPPKIVTFRQIGRDLIRSDSRGDFVISKNINIPADATDYGFKVTRNPPISSPAGTSQETITVELKLISSSDTSIPPFALRTTVIPNNYPGDYGVTGRSFNGDYYETIQ